MNKMENIFGEICKVLIPIPEEVYFGNQKSPITICTLSSMKLLKNISKSNLMNHIAAAGRLLSENKGIDSMIRYVISNNNIKTIILCGKEVWGHRAGHSLLALHRNGIDENNRIIDSASPEPMLSVTQNEVNKFRSQVKIINKIGETNFLQINRLINSIKN